MDKSSKILFKKTTNWSITQKLGTNSIKRKLTNFFNIFIDEKTSNTKNQFFSTKNPIKVTGLDLIHTPVPSA